MKKKYIVEAIEEIKYEMEVEAENEKEAYEIFYQTADNEHIVDSINFDVTNITEVQNETDE
jgi:ribosomal protein L20A (L18A)